MINNSYNSKEKLGSMNQKMNRESSGHSKARQVKFELDPERELSYSKDLQPRRGKLKLDQELVDKDSMIRKSLQSDSYYRRHR
jgi:hypothetical protein